MQNIYRTAVFVTIFSALEHCLGFLYRILLSRVLGSEGLGIYQVALTVFAVFLTVTSSGLPITLSRTITAHRTRKNPKGEQSATAAAILLTLAVSVPVTVLLFLARPAFSKIFSDPRCADLFYILIFSLSFTSVYAVLRGNFWGNKRFFAYSVVELLEEIVMILAGILLLLVFHTGIAQINLAAIAVLTSYLISFSIALFYFLFKGGRLRSPKGEIKPLLKASLPITTMRTSGSLVNSFISVLFPARLMKAGASSGEAMSKYGIVYGMVMPVLMIPSTLISSIALVLVPNLSECFYKNDRKTLNTLVERALNLTLLVAGVLIPFYFVCGGDVGAMLYSNAESGRLIASCAFMLVPMSLTMITTSILNSLQCEKNTLAFFLCGAGAMLLCVWLLPKYLGSGALIVGMASDYLITALLALFLLKKKTESLSSVRYFLRMTAALLPVIAAGYFLRKLFVLYFSYIPALALTMIAIGALELTLFSLFKLYNGKALFARFFSKKRKEVS